MKARTTVTRSLVGAIVLATTLGTDAPAQLASALDGATPPVLAPGAPVGSYELSGFESVNHFGGGLTFHLPIVKLAGQGAPATPVYLTLEKRWVMMFDSDNGYYSYWPAAADDIIPGLASQDYSPGQLQFRVQGRNPFIACSGGASVLFREAITRITFRGSDGTEHEFVDTRTGGSPSVNIPQPKGDQFPGEYTCYPQVYDFNRGRTWVTRDGSFMSLILDDEVIENGSAPSLHSDPSIRSAHGAGLFYDGYLYTKDGTRLRIEQGVVKSVRDRNGKYTTYQYGTDTNNPFSYGRVTSITDPMGRAITISYHNAGVSATDTFDLLTYPGTGGAPRTVEVHYCALEPLVPSNCPNYSGPSTQTYAALFEGYGSSSTKYNTTVVSYVKLPDGRRYEFAYNAYGELVKAKLPTGGWIEYDHGPGKGTSQFIGMCDQSGSCQIYRRVLERRSRLQDGTLATKTKYKATHGTTCPTGVAYCTKVIEESQNSAGAVLAATRHLFYGGADDPESFYWRGYYVDYRNGKELTTEQVNMEGQNDGATAPVLARVAQSWEQRACSAGEVCPTVIGAYPASPVDPRVWRSETTLADTGQTSFSILTFDAYNNVTSKQEYGFSGLVRETVTSYLTTNTISGVPWDYVSVRDNVNVFEGTPPPYSGVVHIRNLPEWREVREGATVEAKTNFYYDDRQPLDASSGLTQWDSGVLAARGNLTKEARWLKTTGSTLDVVRQYFDFGGLHWEQSPRGYKNTYTYGCNGVSLASITNALNHVTSVTADCNTGQPTGITDPNLVTESRGYNDPLDRIRSSANGYTTTLFNYDDAGRIIETRRDRDAAGDASGSGAIRTETVYDGLGRTVETREYGPGGVATKVQTLYDALGRVWKVSNPFQGAMASAWTETLYDSLSRVKSVKTPDNAVTATTYTGSMASVTDPAGSKRDLTSDASGRLVSVTEYPGGPSSYITSYGYNVLDSLTSVTQGTQTRSFVYDSLSRLVSATNPETGRVCYGTIDAGGNCVSGYDANGNLVSRTDARGVVTTMQYDALDRLTRKTYSDGTPEVTYEFDTDQTMAGVSTENKPKGRMVKARNLTSTTVYRYDGIGRPLASQQSTSGMAGLVFKYAHKPAGMASMTYPSGRIVNWSYDEAGRTSAVKDGTGGTDYAPSVLYSPFGGVTQLTLGNALVEKRGYSDVRGQLRRIALGTAVNETAAGEWLFSHCAGGQWTAECASNNGNLRHQTINPLGKVQSYGYDGLNRMSAMLEQAAAAAAPACSGAGPDPCRGFGYDQSGNMWVSAAYIFNAGSFTPRSASNFNARNQVILQGAAYDAAGNQAVIGGYSSQYDGESRVKSSTISDVTTTFDYDGEGRRVKKGSTVFAYDALGTLAAEYGGTAPGGGRRYVTVDHLGSTRVVTDASGAVVEGQRHDYLPFGESLLSGINGRTTAQKYGASENLGTLTTLFTGKERDAETGLDYFGARYFSGAQGRFTSPDPPLLDQHIDDPQSWNLYAYGRNNPLRYVDPTGNAIELLGDEKARNRELALLQKSLGNDKAASRVYINEVKDGDKTRYFVGIKGDVGSFMKMSDTSHDLANLVEHKNIVEFGLASQNLARFGGAVTYEKGEVGNANVRVLVNPDQMDITNRNLSPSSILGMSRWEGQERRPRWNVNDFTPGVAAWHEFGHAWGFINGKPGTATNPEALEWENRMREQLYGPLGPRNARRIRH